MAFNPLYTELILHFPLVPNFLGIIRADFADALTWAKTKTLYAGSTPDFAVHLQCSDLSEDTKTPAIALHPLTAQPELSDDYRIINKLAINAMIMLSGEEPNDLAHALDTYALALAQLWLSAASSELFVGYHASAKRVGGNRREVIEVPYGEDDAPKVRHGKYFRTAIVGLMTGFECA